MEFTRETLAAYGHPRALTWDETLIMIRMADLGGQFYARGDAGRAPFNNLYDRTVGIVDVPASRDARTRAVFSQCVIA